jgi:Zn finger protein HypA/HybF involved in hydrogenase expression
MPRLMCPDCKLDAETEFVRFCPECGSNDVQIKGEGKYFLFWPRCRACAKELSRSAKGNRRRYKIRFCTRCGAYLDKDGL